jgi:hypothetical protein
LLAGFCLPTAAVLGWQYYQTYSGHVGLVAYRDSIIWAPLKVMLHYTTGLLQKFLLFIVFQLLVTLFVLFVASALFWVRQLAGLCEAGSAPIIFERKRAKSLAALGSWEAGQIGNPGRYWRRYSRCLKVPLSRCAARASRHGIARSQAAGVRAPSRICLRRNMTEKKNRINSVM